MIIKQTLKIFESFQFNRYFLSIYYVPGTLLSTLEDSKINGFLFLPSGQLLWWKRWMVMQLQCWTKYDKCHNKIIKTCGSREEEMNSSPSIKCFLTSPNGIWNGTWKMDGMLIEGERSVSASHPRWRSPGSQRKGLRSRDDKNQGKVCFWPQWGSSGSDSALGVICILVGISGCQ